MKNARSVANDISLLTYKKTTLELHSIKPPQNGAQKAPQLQTLPLNFSIFVTSSVNVRLDSTTQSFAHSALSNIESMKL